MVLYSPPSLGGAVKQRMVSLLRKEEQSINAEYTLTQAPSLLLVCSPLHREQHLSVYQHSPTEIGEQSGGVDFNLLQTTAQTILAGAHAPARLSLGCCKLGVADSEKPIRLQSGWD